jgi:serine/threonine protein kinase
VAGALDYAHSNNVVHRDVKPSNVLIAQDGRVILTDFGLALDVQQGSVGEVFGSTHYIAPEQARRSSEAIPQSDLYSLGIMLYEMLTGVVPFDDPSPTAIALQHITQPPPSPRTLNASLAIDTENVLLKALSKSPQERYQTGEALITALENSFNAATEIGQDLPLPPPPPGMELRSQPSLASRETVIEAGVTSAKPTEIPVPITLLDRKPPAPSRDTPLPDQPSKPEKSLVRRPSFLWLGFGGCVLVLIILIVSASLFYSNFRNDDPQNIEPAIAVETKSDIVSTTTAINTPPGDTPEISSPEASTPGLSVLPTVKYPNGRRFMLFYDDNSFYLLNLSDDTIPVNWIAFERLSDAGLPLNRYNGTRWAEFYPDSRPTWCVGLEILDNPPYLEPPECGHDDLYLSLRTPVRDDPTVFWTSMQGSQQFRVLWREGGIDEEIARCEIDEGLCEVFLP